MNKLKTYLCWSAISLISQAAAIAEGNQATQPASVDNSDFAGIPEIVVTAQKRSQSINDVGMSIEAFSGDQLKNQGINNVADLVNVVPGLTVQQTPFGAPAYSL